MRFRPTRYYKDIYHIDYEKLKEELENELIVNVPEDPINSLSELLPICELLLEDNTSSGSDCSLILGNGFQNLIVS